MAQTAADVEFVEIDTSDVDRWVGVPVGGEQPKLPFSANDIRRYVQSVDNPNRLHYDDDYAARSPFGQIVAPQSYFGGGSATGAWAAIQGSIPGSHMLFGGDEQWFYGPRIYAGDRLRMDRMLFDYRVTQTRFAGPTMFSRGDTTYLTQVGDLVAKQRSTAIRYLVENSAKVNVLMGLTTEPEWTDEQLEQISMEKIAWVKSFPGSSKRLWKDVSVGEQMIKRPIGPHSLQTFTTEARGQAVPTAWGSHEYFPPLPASNYNAGWLPVMSRDASKVAVDPSFADGLVYGASRGHMQARYANVIGMPRGYGYGATMCAWVVDYTTNWGGDWCFLRHHKTQYRNPALVGNVTYLTGSVTNKWLDEQFGLAIVELSYEMADHTGTTMAKGVAELALPQSEDDDSAVTLDPRVKGRLDAAG
jgi:acyl dehydratase